MRFAAKLTEGARHHRADVAYLHQRFFVGIQQHIQSGKMTCQILRRRLADVADTQRVNEAGKRGFAASGDRFEQIGCRLFGHALQSREGGSVKPVEIGRGAHVIAIDQLFDELFTQPLDVHGAARGKVNQRLLALCRTEEPGRTARHGLVLPARHGRGADRTDARHDEFRRQNRALFGQYAHHFGDHITRAADYHRITDVHILAPHLVLIVQRGIGDSDAADEHRRQPRHRRQRAGPANLHVDAEHQGQGFLGRVFVRHRPARLTRDKTELRLQGQRIHLVHHAVDVERQAGALSGDVLMKPGERLRALQHGAQGAHRQAESGERVKNTRMAGGQRPTLYLTQTIGKKGQRTARGNL